LLHTASLFTGIGTKAPEEVGADGTLDGATGVLR
jgi:hypothetical protein